MLCKSWMLHVFTGRLSVTANSIEWSKQLNLHHFQLTCTKFQQAWLTQILSQIIHNFGIIPPSHFASVIAPSCTSSTDCCCVLTPCNNTAWFNQWYSYTRACLGLKSIRFCKWQGKVLHKVKVKELGTHAWVWHNVNSCHCLTAMLQRRRELNQI